MLSGRERAGQLRVGGAGRRREAGGGDARSRCAARSGPRLHPCCKLQVVLVYALPSMVIHSCGVRSLFALFTGRVAVGLSLCSTRIFE